MPEAPATPALELLAQVPLFQGLGPTAHQRIAAQFIERRLDAGEVLVDILNLIFSAFDRLADQHPLEKIKTIGDAYMAAAGLPEPRVDHVIAVAEMALEMRKAVTVVGARCGDALGCRIGIHTVPVIAGIIGTKRFSYDLWGDTVNIASRMESHGVPGEIQVSRAVHDRLGGVFLTEPRGTIEVKRLGSMEAFFPVGRRRGGREAADSPASAR